jgi:two-component sensor histidine kinase
MQSRAVRDPEVKHALATAQSRVQAIAKVHDRLWRKDEVLEIDLAEFLGELCEELRATAPQHKVLHEIASVTLATDQAISLGLISNEAITNALKYAFPEGSGTILVMLSAEKPDQLRLEISDNGVGLPSDFESKSAGLGKKVISTLSQQLNGEIKWENADPGTRLVVTFQPKSF